MKSVLSQVLEFRGHRALCGIQIVESGEARRDKVVDVQDGTRGSSGPRDMYA